jgi:hypothetical protein
MTVTYSQHDFSETQVDILVSSYRHFNFFDF